MENWLQGAKVEDLLKNKLEDNFVPLRGFLDTYWETGFEDQIFLHFYDVEKLIPNKNYSEFSEKPFSRIMYFCDWGGIWGFNSYS